MLGPRVSNVFHRVAMEAMGYASALHVESLAVPSGPSLSSCAALSSTSAIFTTSTLASPLTALLCLAVIVQWLWLQRGRLGAQAIEGSLEILCP